MKWTMEALFRKAREEGVSMSELGRRGATARISRDKHRTNRFAKSQVKRIQQRELAL